MARQRNIFLIALLCSLGLHLASFGVYIGYDRLRPPERAVAIVPHPLTQPIAGPKPQDEIVIYPDMGEADATGIGSNSSPGEHPLQARPADEDQALLSRDAQGSGRIGAAPSNWKGPTGDGAGGSPAGVTPATPVREPGDRDPAKPSPEKPPEQSSPERAETPPAPNHAASAAPVGSVPHEVTPPQPAEPHDPSPPPPDKREQVAMVLPSPQPLPSPVHPEPAPDVAANQSLAAPAPRPRPPTPPVPPVPQSATGDGRRPGLPVASAEPLPQSESDSDPFSRLSDTFVFRDGRLQPRQGRKVKTTRPQVHIAGQIDMIALNNPTVVLEVHIEKTGKVSDVKIAHSSGSNQIDEPTRLAVYDWWFEPRKDKKGNPVSDVIYFSVQFL